MIAPRQALTSPLLSRLLALGESQATAVIDEAGRVRFDELVAAAREVARQLGDAGAAGRRVALATSRSREWLVGFWGILLAGGTVVPLSESQPAPERRRLLAQSAACALLASGGSELDDAIGETPRWELSGARLERPGGASISAMQSGAAIPGDLATRPALLLFTSGTTGTPKGVPLDHQTMLAGIDQLIEAWSMRADDRLVHTLPLHHLHGICVALGSTFLAGGTTELLPRFDPQRVLEAAERSSVLMGVPTTHQRLLDYLDACDPEPRRRHLRALSRLRLITSGSAKLPERLGKRLLEASGQYPLERYGMTEVGIVLGNPLEGPRVPGSCGRPLPGCDVRIVDDAGRDVAAGHAGEIWIRGASVFRGYDADPAATAAAFADGYFKSGDTARFDEDGFVRILGRTSVDIIKSGGYKLSAIEIEEQLREHEQVEDAAVVGLADEEWGERTVAVVVAKPALADRSASDPDAAARELRDFLKGRLSAYKVPRQVVFRDELPRNALGKVRKTQLRDALLGASEVEKLDP